MSTSTGFLPIGNLAPPVPGLPDQADLNPLLTRTHYFDGRLLTAADLTRDQLYLDQRLREVGQALGRGVVRGFAASLQGGRITLQPGIAINGNGRVLQLRTPLVLDLNDRATIAGLNDGQHLHLETGLYALVVSYVEEGSGSAEIFPRDLDGRSIQHDVDVEGIQAALVALPDPPPMASDLSVRALLMARLALGGLGSGVVPEHAVALGVLAIRDDRPEWLDTTLMRHPARSQPAPGDLQSDLHRRYEALLSDVLARRLPLGGDFAATEYFSLLPPTGRCPKAAVNPVAGRQGFFPEHFRVSIAPIRQSDLEVVQRESMALPAIDLARDEPVDLVVLAPLPGESFGRLAAALERQPVAAVPEVLMPHLDLLALRLYPLRPVHRVATDADAWQALWAEIGDTAPIYVRRPTRAAETGISGIRIASGTPVVLPAGDPDEPPPEQPPASPSDGDTLVLDRDAVVLERVNLERLVNLRPSVDGMGLEVRAVLADEIRDDANLMLACMDLLILVERRFDPVLWMTLLTAARAGALLELRDLVAEPLGAAPDSSTAETMMEALGALGIDNGLPARWEAAGAGG